MTQQTGDNRDLQLPGYTLVRRIGEGGYGEVWLAHAPGGLTKAVKFIFGFHNEKRASRELHSLEKIKSVRHPFLLSLERIEVIEGRLVIVTELADASLRDRFEACIEEGLPGIPREELLRYLRDTSDALDYLGDEHSLQHLDVKPENLLLLAGHIKVADFGLVKEIQDTQASLVGGMTPLYSAPEVFQGRPSSFSDQYSLAVLYQEMMTGKLPFTGATSAELTLQHMHDEPDLSSLPLTDRYVLARALSKDPAQRFKSCGELIHALLAANSDGDDSQQGYAFGSKATSPTPKCAAVSPGPTPRPGTLTQVFEDDLVVESAEVSKSMLLDMPPPVETAATGSPPLEFSPETFRPTPTLVIGIGGTAGHVLAQLHHNILSRQGASHSIPAVQMLLLDTDPKAIREIVQTDNGPGLTSQETLTLALRRPQDYRDRSAQLLHWLSRRWLYNIPRSLRTEGLRPLGRLAFADHSRRTLQRIRLSLSQALDENAIAASNEQAGLQFRDRAVRVYVVSSISGGTGSGMSLDVAYAVRTILEKLGVADTSTIGVFMHSTGRDSRFGDLAKVNAYSWLTEFNHFNRPEGFYPGDTACGLPAQCMGTSVLDNSYLVHLGNGLRTEEFIERTKMVADYLYLDALTPAQMFFEASRAATRAASSDFTTLRTFGLHKVSLGSESAMEAAAAMICHRVVLGWAGAESHNTGSPIPNNLASNFDTAPVSDTNQLVCGSAQAVAQLQLGLQGIAANARAMIESQFGTHVEGLIEKLLAKTQETGTPATHAEITRVVDGLFTPPQNANSQQAEFALQRPLESIVSPLGLKLVADLQKWILRRLDDRQERLFGTQCAAEWFADHFQRVEAEAKRVAHRINQHLQDMVESNPADSDAATPHSTADHSTPEWAVKYFRLSVDLAALQATVHLTQMLQAELRTIRETIVEFGRHLRHLAETLSQDPESLLDAGATLSPAAPSNEQDHVTKLLAASLPERAIAVDKQLQEHFIDQHGGLFETVMSSGKVVSELLVALKTIARQHIEKVVREASFADQGNSLFNGKGDRSSVQQHVAEASPALLCHGGVANHLAILPEGLAGTEQADQIRASLGSEVSTLTSGNDVILCCESGRVPLVHTAIDLIQCRRDYADFAKRVHTRNDIDWTPLAATTEFAREEQQEFATQVL